VKLPIAWLRDYLDITIGADDVAEKLALLGFPVDAIERRPRISGVIVGRIAALEKHPNADRLLVCTLDVGAGRPLTIATAATNVAAGQHVPVATIGAQLVGLQIAPRTMRGVESQGMLVSAGEIGLPPEWFEDGILQLGVDALPGADFAAAYGLNDDVLDVEVTPNRVDAMSVTGLARELGAALGTPAREPQVLVSPEFPDSGAAVTLESTGCRRFVAQRFSNVGVRPAPFWMRVRLALAGQRPIDNLVDISNFVMLETAQPLHFYDFAKIAGGRLIVRDARAGERLRTLDGETRELDPSFLVIADEREIQGLAGLKGGAASEVTPHTRELLLEAAVFDGPRIRRTALALGLRTEASARHEKGLPLGIAGFAAARAAYLLAAEGATVHAPLTAGTEPRALTIALSLERVASLLGTEIPRGEAEAALRSLGFGLAADAPPETLAVTPPPWRGDVALPEDVVEEIARIVGYERIPEALPRVAAQPLASTAYLQERGIANALAALGYREALSFSLQPAAVAERVRGAGVPLPGAVAEIANPLSEDQRYLRFSLLPGLLALAQKYGRDGNLRYFEIGHIFEGAPETFETAMAAWLALEEPGDGPAWRDAGFLAFKGDALALLRALTGHAAEAVTGHAPGLHPGKTATLLLDGKDAAYAGAVDPRLLAAYDIAGAAYAGFMRLADLPAYRVPAYVAPSRFPAVARDLAVVVGDGVPAMDLERAARAAAGGVLADVRVFDEYRGPQIDAGKKSLALRLVLQRADATLTDAEAEAHVAAILESLRERCGAQLRE
jgi:phenylalanyl-tRNA synthetase beta chain